MTPEPPDLPALHAQLLAHFPSGHPDHGLRLGAGGEATVYALDARRVLRIYRQSSPLASGLEAVYQRWSGRHASSFDIPEVLSSGLDAGLRWEVMRRFPGRPVSRWLRTLLAQDRAALLNHYVDAAFEIGEIEAAPTYGPLLGAAEHTSWAECLRARLAVPEPRFRARLAADIPDLTMLIDRFESLGPTLYDGEPRLVHVDYFPGNVMAAPSAGRLRISGVFDFSAHSLFGDPLLDVVGAIVMADMFTSVTPEEQAAMRAHARLRAGARLDHVFDSYQLFYALYYAMDEALLPWCATQLRRSRLR